MASHRYTSVAVVLHWTIAILIIGQIIGGLYMHNLPNSSAIKFDLYQLHKSFGVSVLVLSLARLGWRLSHKAPSLPVVMPDWQKFAARATHWGFYALMIAAPLTGLAMVSVSPLDIPTKLFGVIPVPHLPFFGGVADRAAMEEVIAEIHKYLAFGIIGLLLLHVAAALKHQLMDKDEVMQTMTIAKTGQWVGIAAIVGVLGVGAVLYVVAPAAPANATLAANIDAPDEAGANWIVDYDASHLQFIGEEKGRPFEGAFNDFRAVINFDPDDLDGSTIQVDVLTTSASTGDGLRDSNLPNAEWFDTSNHPMATFRSENITAKGEGAYQAAGVLVIKEFGKPVTLAFDLDIDGDKAVARGGADLVRTDFGLGANSEWLDDEGLALAVRVEFEIHASRQD